jgi:hypothetical protein
MGCHPVSPAAFLPRPEQFHHAQSNRRCGGQPRRFDPARLISPRTPSATFNDEVIVVIHTGGTGVALARNPANTAMVERG